MSEYPDTLNAVSRQYEAILEATSIVSKTDSEGVITYVNDQYCELSGYSKEQSVGRAHSLLGSTDLSDDIVSAMWEKLRKQEAWSGVLTERHKAGSEYHVRVDVYPILKASGATAEYVVVYREVDEASSEERVLEEIDRRQQMQQHLEYLQSIIDQQHNIIVVLDGTELVLVNHQFLEFFAMATLEAFKEEFEDIGNAFVMHDNYFHLGKVLDRDDWVHALQVLPDEKSVISMVDLRTNDPRAFAVKVSHLEEGADFYVISFTDITDLTIKANQYFYEATHDRLTGSMNRSHFSEVLAERVEESKAAGTALVMLMIGIDAFKSINEKYGSHKGDGIIKSLAETVSMHLRMHDVLARWGGTEFALLMPAAEVEKAQKMADNIKEAVAIMPTNIDEEVTVSIAITPLEETQDARTFIMKAYDALLSIRRAE